MPKKMRRNGVMKGGNNDLVVSAAQEGILSDKMILPSSRFESTGTSGDHAKYETAVSKHMTGGKRRSKKSKKTQKRCKSMKKWFGLF